MLTVRENPSEIADVPSGYAAAYINVGTRTTGILSGPSDNASDLQSMLNTLLATGQARSYFVQNPPRRCSRSSGKVNRR